LVVGAALATRTRINWVRAKPVRHEPRCCRRLLIGKASLRQGNAGVENRSPTSTIRTVFHLANCGVRRCGSARVGLSTKEGLMFFQSPQELLVLLEVTNPDPTYARFCYRVFSSAVATGELTAAVHYWVPVLHCAEYRPPRQLAGPRALERVQHLESSRQTHRAGHTSRHRTQTAPLGPPPAPLALGRLKGPFVPLLAFRLTASYITRNARRPSADLRRPPACRGFGAGGGPTDPVPSLPPPMRTPLKGAPHHFYPRKLAHTDVHEGARLVQTHRTSFRPGSSRRKPVHPLSHM